MGIQGLKRFLKTHFNITEKPLHLSNLKNQIVAVDVSIFMYKFMYIENKNMTYIHLFLYQIYSFVKNGIRPIYIFDGKPPSEKSETIEKRKERTQQLKESNKFYVQPTKQNFRQLQKLLGTLGIPYVLCNTESDIVCSKMDKDGMIDGVFTEDMDYLTHGIRNVYFDLKPFQEDLSNLSLPEILSISQLSYKDFVDLCILLGCDYCKKIPTVGPIRALGLLKKFLTIEGILDNMSESIKEKVDLASIQKTRNIFMDVSNIKYGVTKTNYNKDAFLDYLKEFAPILKTTIYTDCFAEFHSTDPYKRIENIIVNDSPASSPKTNKPDIDTDFNEIVDSDSSSDDEIDNNTKGIAEMTAKFVLG